MSSAFSVSRRSNGVDIRFDVLNAGARCQGGGVQVERPQPRRGRTTLTPAPDGAG